MQREGCIITGGGAQRNIAHELFVIVPTANNVLPAAAPDGRGELATIVQGADSTVIRKATRADRPRISEIRFAVRENRPSNPAVIEPLVDWLFDNSTFWAWEEVIKVVAVGQRTRTNVDCINTEFAGFLALVGFCRRKK